MLATSTTRYRLAGLTPKRRAEHEPDKASADCSPIQTTARCSEAEDDAFRTKIAEGDKPDSDNTTQPQAKIQRTAGGA